MCPTLQTTEIWFLTGSQGLYGEDVIKQVEAQSPDIAEQLGASPAIVPRIVRKPVLTDADTIRRLTLEANAAGACAGIIAWMRTFSPAKMWISGLDALRKPLLHLHRAGPDRRRHQTPPVRAAAALEPGVLPPGPGLLSRTKLHCPELAIVALCSVALTVTG